MRAAFRRNSLPVNPLVGNLRGAAFLNVIARVAGPIGQRSTIAICASSWRAPAAGVRWFSRLICCVTDSAEPERRLGGT